MRTRAAGSAGGERLVSGFALLVYASAALAPLAAILFLAPRQSTRGFAEMLFSPRSLRAAAFTLEQAVMSTVAALAIGLPGAALVARYKFPWRRALKALSVLPFSVPSVLIVLAFALFYGRAGHLNRLLMGIFGLSEPPVDFLYGFWGIVLVHGFYEFPRRAADRRRGLGNGFPASDPTRRGTLGARKLEGLSPPGPCHPSLQPSPRPPAALCFLLCFFSFAVVMVFRRPRGIHHGGRGLPPGAQSRPTPKGAALRRLGRNRHRPSSLYRSWALCERSARSGSARSRAAGSPAELMKPRGAGPRRP